MHLTDSWWRSVVYVLDFLTHSSTVNQEQQAILSIPPQVQHDPSYPIFEPPNGPEIPGTDDIKCEYPSMPQYTDCSDREDRSCWLRGPRRNYTISTDYERHWPVGITRKYYLELSNMTLNQDGVAMKQGKVFNQTYPGPWIRACWGDELEITIKNKLPDNGTTIHWHGLRQLGSVEMDGVNAVTQCPIAPNDTFTYKFRAIQYGTTWYHSHYSLQYADGVLGPMTIYGPSSAPYDTAKDPLLMTDWSHQSAFESWSTGKTKADSILLNGIGQYIPPVKSPKTSLIVDVPQKYSTVFQKALGVRYLLRLINTSVDTTFLFSIDNHNLTIVGADFVPVHPYQNDSVLVGIGQRYHVVVEANPNIPSSDGNYWIHTIPAKNCGNFNGKIETKTGIVRYDPLSTSDPTTHRPPYDIKCSDETYSSLRPILPWQVDPDIRGERNYTVDLTKVGGPPYNPQEPKNRWSIHEKTPMWLNFSKPTVLNLQEDWRKQKHAVVIESDHERETWVEMVIIGAKVEANPNARAAPKAAHPIHLHGHDFALLAQSDLPYDEKEARKLIVRDNPPRRDVALLPAGGYLIIAFKADNPGAWLMHCHIAWHASSGLALQILENKDRIKFDGKMKAALQGMCDKWNVWCLHGGCIEALQDDSGI